MELKCDKVGIVTEKIIFDEIIEQGVEADFTLPEYMPEISRMLKCFSTPMLLDKSINGQTLTVDGDLNVNCVYADQNGCPHSYEYKIPFRKNIELPSDDEVSVDISLKIGFLNYRPTGQRRIDIRGQVCISVKAVKKESTDILSSFLGGSVETLKKEISYSMPIGKYEKGIIIDEELDITADRQPISEILNYRAYAEIDDTKIISGKIIVKGNFFLHILYMAENAKRPAIYETTIPFSQMLDANIGEDDAECDAVVSVAALDIKERKDLDSVTVGISLEAKLIVEVKVQRRVKSLVLTDGFSTEYLSQIEYDDIEYSSLLGEIHEHYICKKSIEIQEGTLIDVAEIFSTVSNEEAKCEDGKISVSGTVNIHILGYNDEKSAVYFEKPLDFSYTFPFENLPKNAKVDARCTVTDTSYSLSDSGKIEVRASMAVDARITNVDRLPVICSVKVDENQKKTGEKDCTLAIYYTKEGEIVWEIAKRYNTKVDEIIKANSLDTEMFSRGEMLLIPCI